MARELRRAAGAALLAPVSGGVTSLAGVATSRFFQLFRGLLWAAIALVVIRTTRGGLFDTAGLVALVFAALFASQLLLPNPYMPESVRMRHLLETASSNTIFGFLGVLALAAPRPRSPSPRPV